VRTGALILIVALASGCGGDGDASTGETAENGATPDDSSTDVDEAAMRSRLDEIAAQVAVWRTSDDLAEVRSASEAAANLIVGPQGPGYGDRDGDGSVSGENDQGLLPGLDGTIRRRPGPRWILPSTLGHRTATPCRASPVTRCASSAGRRSRSSPTRSTRVTSTRGMPNSTSTSRFVRSTAESSARPVHPMRDPDVVERRVASALGHLK
jgi:hypothetical protein